jgi:peptidoglycan hydrolase-like protein with peptidoglycan-binding domain
MIPLSFEGDDTNQLPSLKLCNQFNNPNPIPEKGAFGNQSRQRMFYSDGDRGRQVEILQRMLVELGYDLGASGQGGDGVDGIFGDKTRRP